MIDDSVAMTPFYLLLGKHRQQQQGGDDPRSGVSAERTPLPQGSVAIKEVGGSALRGLCSLCVVYKHFLTCSCLLEDFGSRNSNGEYLFKDVV